MSGTNLSIEAVQLREISPALARELYAATEPLHQEATPDEPRPTFEQTLAELRGLPAAMDGWALIARDGASQIMIENRLDL